MQKPRPRDIGIYRPAPGHFLLCKSPGAGHTFRCKSPRVAGRGGGGSDQCDTGITLLSHIVYSIFTARKLVSSSINLSCGSFQCRSTWPIKIIRVAPLIWLFCNSLLSKMPIKELITHTNVWHQNGRDRNIFQVSLTITDSMERSYFVDIMFTISAGK